MAEEQQQQVQGPAPEIVEEAKALGWRPKEEFNGDVEKWVDADVFVERGRHILPIVQENNRRLQDQLKQVTGKLSSLESALKGAETTIEMLQESHAADVKEQVDAARKALKAELAEASRDGDHERVADLTEKMVELNSANREAGGQDEGGEGKGGKPANQQPNPAQAPWFLEFMGEHPELQTDPELRVMVDAEARLLRSRNDPSTEKAFLDKAYDAAMKRLGRTGKGGTSKVEGSRGGQGGPGAGGGNGQSYADLPKEAKDVCERQAKNMVGPNRRYKDMGAWRARYAELYFGQQ